LEKAQPVSIKVIDSKGRLSKVEGNDLEYIGHEGENEITMNVANLPRGMYFIVLTTNEYVVEKRVIKLK
jgi:hypothetical protein